MGCVHWRMSRAFNSGQSAKISASVERLTCCTDHQTGDPLPRSVSVLQRSSPAETTRLQLLQVFREAQIQNTLEFHKYKLRLPSDLVTNPSASEHCSSTLMDQESHPSPKGHTADSCTTSARPRKETTFCQWPAGKPPIPDGRHPPLVDVDFRKYFEDTDPNAGRSPNHRIGHVMSPFSFTKPLGGPPPDPQSSQTTIQNSQVSRTPGSSLIEPNVNGLISSVSSLHYFPKPPPVSPTLQESRPPLSEVRERVDSNSDPWSHPPFASKDQQCRTVVGAVVKSRQGLKYRQGFLLTLRRYCPRPTERRLIPEAEQIVLALTRNRKSKIYEIGKLSIVDSSASCMSSLKTHLGGSSEVWCDVPFEFLEKCARTLVCYFEEHSMPAVLVFASQSERDEFLFALRSLLSNVEGRDELTQFIFDG